EPRTIMTPLAIALPAVSLFAALAAEATPPSAASPPPSASAEAAGLAERLHAETQVAGGLTADEVARRTEAGSGDVAAKGAEVEAAAAAVDQALVAYVPRLAG